ncbi:MAG TPA: carotenoid oxygenase family protein [Gordonia sp. (in: high G+C Gram-positive bacteria)]|uniref:carotenoid oxygenase family protein n=1 Tax=unclassified Gordonia (in: high G+C Gram-positive bacteria) TaxID=2657482 RepID=UPI0025C40E20|nr:MULTISPECIES: carotenoid oxygenase family protein [unclassified Gordonia (in: high G+C Gram-positive bacteria)]HNP58391.1 carotenoid oxygenase family protein [Gordonia sp. (in: high G+C Gram-positive bacteria)]HRC51993.1 carotenoid oxygenase family protein [Gordonia sp. (in: high G+C Gram-positive bacteria)]
MTEPALVNSDRRHGSSPWDAQEEEFDYRVEEVHGAIPASLRGVLYRIGPGRLKVGELRFGHIFDGDGMISRFEFSDDGVSFRNRYVRTKHFAMASSTWIGRGIGTQRLGGFLGNVFRMPSNVSNTNIVSHANGLFSLWEGGRPYRIDPETLETRGTETFDGTLKHMGAFSAHPKIDVATGEMFNFGLEMFPRPMLRTFCRDAHGRMKVLAPVKLSRPVLCHDFALTEHYLVFLIDPIVFSRPITAALGLDSMDHCLSFEEKQGTRVVLVPRDGGKPRVVDTEALFHFHNANAWEENGDVVVEFVAHPTSQAWDPFNEALRDYENNVAAAFGGRMERLRITGNRVTHEHLADVECEFPQLDQRFATRAHPTTYVAASSLPGGEPDSLVSLDHATGRQDMFTVAAGNTICEPLFAPDPETDGGGWLLSVEHLADEARSRLLVLDAEHLADGPIASAELTNHIPMGFHGTFVPAAS